MDWTEKLNKIYEHHHKKMMILPLLLVLLSFLIVGLTAAKTGDIMEKDVSLAGGITATISTEQPLDLKILENELSKTFSDVDIKGLSEFGTNRQIGVIIEVSSNDEKLLTQTLEQTLAMKLTEENYSIEVVGSSLGASFYQQMLKAMIFAFLFMAIVVFIVFRSFVPSFATVFAAFSDILVTIAFVNLIHLKISSAGIAALLMLIGYSVDTDILQTTRVLKKREASPIEGVTSSIKTGLTMTLTSIIAVLLGFIFATSAVFKEMFIIISFGLFVDIIMTYLMNAPMLIMYMKRKEQRTTITHPS